MTIKFCGAARAVTGSSHLLTLDDGFSILLDCGLYQGNDNALDNFNNNWYFDPKSIDCMVLSHAHIDHCGRIPKLYKDGFRGSVFCTHATRDLASIMLMDSARIQVRDAEYLNKKSGRYAFGQATALYDTHDVKHSIEDFVGIGYEHWYRIHPNVEILLRDAGHILGSASVVLRIKRADGSTTTFGFSGDIGRPDRPILRDPLAMEQCDYLICESTYGAKWHQGRPDDENTLLKIIKETCIDNQGKLIIPAFSVGRTQEIVYMLDTLETYGKLTQIPVFVDSPLAINATQIFQSHPECFDDELMEYLLFDPNPWGFNRLRYVRRVSDSKKLNQIEGPAIIISASGMASSGRVRHHLFHALEDARNTVLIVGYCAPNTLGGKLRRGAKQVHLFGQRKQVNAQVATMDSFSAHADQQEMIDFLDNQDRKQLKRLFLVHGELDNQQKFKQVLEQEQGFRQVHIPYLGESVKL